MPAPLWGFFAIFLLLTLAGPALAKHKDDVVVMKNGDRMTREMRSLESGRELIKDLYRSFRLYENYDTDRPAAKSDFGVTGSLGYRF